MIFERFDWSNHHTRRAPSFMCEPFFRWYTHMNPQLGVHPIEQTPIHHAYWSTTYCRGSLHHSPLHHCLVRSWYLLSHHRPLQPMVAANLSYNSVSPTSSISSFFRFCACSFWKKLLWWITMAVLRMVGSIDVFPAIFHCAHVSPFWYPLVSPVIPFHTRKPGESLKLTVGTAKTWMVIPNRCGFLEHRPLELR